MWKIENGKHYWYENGVKQGTASDKKCAKDSNGKPRGREIYDPGTNTWYWLDACYDGARAENKEVWIPYIYQGDDGKKSKWVRYDHLGKMIKGWCRVYTGIVDNVAQYNYYFYDPDTGAMIKDYKIVDKNAWDNIRSSAIDPTLGCLSRVHTMDVFNFNIRRNCIYV